MKKIPGIFLFICMLLPSHFTVSHQYEPTKEYQLKAIFLYNFAQFVKWPDDTFANPHSPLIIGILGNDPFGTFLDETAKGDSINGHPLQIHRYQSLNDVVSCHILFINTSGEDGIPHLLNRLEGQSVLTVGEGKNFARMGGMIGFTKEDNRIKLHVNLLAAKSAGLDISSKLLRLSTIVNSRGDEG